MLIRYKKGTEFYSKNPMMLRFAGYFVVLSAWSAAIVLHSHNPLLVIYIILLVAAADTGAYFAGKAFGENKLVPHISPGKTWEGLLGGLAASTLIAVLGTSFLGVGDEKFVNFLVLSLITALLSVAGDLFISLMKREAGQKDSGNILPGHGGILDRVDGLIAVLPLFALGLSWASIQL